MKPVIKKIILIFLIILGFLIATGVILFVIVFKIISSTVDQNISHAYTISETQTLFVDNTDCGATCYFTTRVYKQTIKKYGRVKNELLLTCEGTEDIQFDEVTESSARISSIQSYRQDCLYEIGHRIEY